MSGVYKDPDYMVKYRKRNRSNRNEYLKIWRKKNPDKIKHHNLMINYGISLETYNQMVEDRNGKCDLCHKITKLHVDHCHETKRIRGLLCGTCNRSLGVLGDTIQSIEKVLEYLRREYGHA